MKNISTEGDIKPVVCYFHRRPRNGINYSIESIFADLRDHLKEKIGVKVAISSYYNDGYLTKFLNLVEATFRQNNPINHITGEIHFINLLMRRKTVLLTIHDCGMVARKTGFKKRLIKWLYLDGPVGKSTYITVVSNYTKQEVIAQTGCAPGKITVIPVAVNKRYQPSAKNFNSIKPNILQIGTTPNKNIHRLIEALENISCHLTIIGALDTEIKNLLSRKSISYSNHSRISDEELLEHYQASDIVSFVSTFEGFGMPIIEANAVGRAVITSNISSMPEVAGNAACLVNPFSAEDIKAGILKLINDTYYRDTLIENGKKNKLRFESDRIANQYYDLYRRMLN